MPTPTITSGSPQSVSFPAHGPERERLEALFVEQRGNELVDVSTHDVLDAGMDAAALRVAGVVGVSAAAHGPVTLFVDATRIVGLALAVAGGLVARGAASELRLLTDLFEAAEASAEADGWLDAPDDAPDADDAHDEALAVCLRTLGFDRPPVAEVTLLGTTPLLLAERLYDLTPRPLQDLRDRTLMARAGLL